MSAARVDGAQAVRRAATLLRILAAGGESGLRLTDIALQSGIERPTVHRILRALVEEGAAEQDAESRRYLIGQDISLLGMSRTSRLRIRTLADPHLRQIAGDLGDTVFLVIRSGPDAICVDRKSGSYPVKVHTLEIGTRRPLGTGISGIMLLAQLRPDAAVAVVRENTHRYKALKVNPDVVLKLVSSARVQGYAHTEKGFIARSARAVAVAVDGLGAEHAAAISYAAIADRMPPSRLPVVVAALREQAAQITAKLAAEGRPRSGV